MVLLQLISMDLVQSLDCVNVEGRFPFDVNNTLLKLVLQRATVVNFCCVDT